MEAESKRIIQRQHLDNGIELILYDRSRVLAGDRWLVDLLCEAHLCIDECYWENLPDEDVQLLTDIKKMLGKKLVYAINKKRKFVASFEKETILHEMVQELQDAILEYLKRPAFPERLFKKQYQDSRQKILVSKAMSRKGG
jgi:hypothetical protein